MTPDQQRATTPPEPTPPASSPDVPVTGSAWSSPQAAPPSSPQYAAMPSSGAFGAGASPFPVDAPIDDESRRGSDPLVMIAGVLLAAHLLVVLFGAIAPAIWLSGSDALSPPEFGIVSTTITVIGWLLALAAGIVALLGFRNARATGRPGYVPLGIAAIAGWETVQTILVVLIGFVTQFLWGRL